MNQNQELTQLRARVQELTVDAAALEAVVKLLIEHMRRTSLLSPDDQAQMIGRVRANLSPNASLPDNDFSEALESRVISLFAPYP